MKTKKSITIDDFKVTKSYNRSLSLWGYAVQILQRQTEAPLSMIIQFKLSELNGHYVMFHPIVSVAVHAKDEKRFSFGLDNDFVCVKGLVSGDFYGRSTVPEYKNIIMKWPVVDRNIRPLVPQIERYCSPEKYDYHEREFLAAFALSEKEIREAGRVLYGHRNFIREVYTVAKSCFGNIENNVNSQRIDGLLQSPNNKDNIKTVLCALNAIHYHVCFGKCFPENNILRIIDDFAAEVIRLFTFYRRRFNQDKPVSVSIEKFAIIFTHALLMSELKVIDLITHRTNENIRWLKESVQKIRPNSRHCVEYFVIDRRDVENIFDFRIRSGFQGLRIEYDLLFDSKEYYRILWTNLCRSFSVFCRYDSY